MERPVVPKPPRGADGAGDFAPVVVEDRLEVGTVEVRVSRANIGVDQCLELEVELDRYVFELQDRRGGHGSTAGAPGTTGATVAGRVAPGSMQSFRGGINAMALAPTPPTPINSSATCDDRFIAASNCHRRGAQ
jgi:hypothetical protein